MIEDQLQEELWEVDICQRCGGIVDFGDAGLCDRCIDEINQEDSGV